MHGVLPVQWDKEEKTTLPEETKSAGRYTQKPSAQKGLEVQTPKRIPAVPKGSKSRFADKETARIAKIMKGILTQTGEYHDEDTSTNDTNSSLM